MVNGWPRCGISINSVSPVARVLVLNVLSKCFGVFAATDARLRRRAYGHWVRQVDAEDDDDGLSRSFLVGATEEMRAALRLIWAGELPLRQGEDLPGDVGSEVPNADACRCHFSGFCYETVNCLVGVILKGRIFQSREKGALVHHFP